MDFGLTKEWSDDHMDGELGMGQLGGALGVGLELDGLKGGLIWKKREGQRNETFCFLPISVLRKLWVSCQKKFVTCADSGKRPGQARFDPIPKLWIYTFPGLSEEPEFITLTGESRGFAFVRYKYADEAQEAVERLDKRIVDDGREITVQFAKYGPNAERMMDMNEENMCMGKTEIQG
ncbi:RNA recognition motif domain [Dillenia turbinata]|uniref:RNA recognition motif domain n=1 Tax=Dillenia turbinata TaxID=194707 RepID=A0AAN8UL79_9MAGN